MVIPVNFKEYDYTSDLSGPSEQHATAPDQLSVEFFIKLS